MSFHVARGTVADDRAGGQRNTRRQYGALSFEWQRFNNDRNVRIFLHNLFQHRIELFAVRAVVIRKVHQRQLRVFSAYPRAGRIVKQRRMDQIFNLLFLIRRKGAVSARCSASKTAPAVKQSCISLGYSFRFFNVCNTASRSQQSGQCLPFRQAGAIYLIKRHGDRRAFSENL